LSRRVIVLSRSLFALFLFVVLLTSFVQAQNASSAKPFSGGYLAARAFHEGKFSFVNSGYNPLAVEPNALTCSPAPCIFKSVDASEGGAGAVNEDPVAVNPNNPQQILTGGNDFNCVNVQGFFATSDGGTTWSRKCSPGSGGQGDPIVGYDLNNVAYAGGIQNFSVVDFISKDNGKTWGNPITVITPVLGYLADKPWLEVDVNANSPRKNSIYVSTTQFDFSSGSQIWVSNSTDGGKTWNSTAVSTKQTFPTNVDQFSDLAVGADGTVYLSWLRCPAAASGICGGELSQIMFSRSKDGGKTWSKEKVAGTVTLVPSSCGAFYGCLPNTFERVSNIASNTVTGVGATAQVYISVYNWTGSQMQVEVLGSKNGGQTWGAPVLVTPGSKGDQFFQWANVSKNGKLLAVTWLDRRNDPNNLMYQPFYAISKDGGQTFGKAVALTGTKSNPNNDGRGGSFIGDYRTHVWSGSSIIAVWMDTRTNTSQDEVGGVKLH